MCHIKKHSRTQLWLWMYALWLLAAAARPARSAELNLIPLPASVTQSPGQFTLDARTSIAADLLFTNEAALLAGEFHLSPTADPSKNQIRLTTEGAEKLGDEAYFLSVDQNGVVIRANSAAGAFYGCQTLRQLLLPGTRQIPCVKIADAPRYAWRGFMLDVSRHFFDVGTLRQMIDWMADYKMNRLHLHLTDDQAWRLEISQYPRLTQIGAHGNFSDPQAPAYFYTAAEMRDIIQYAAQRHIIVVPEIDMPGHAAAATRAYPEFDGGTNTFNPARPETYAFLQNVLSSVMDIFPSPWIHVGGDEVNLTTWNRNPDVARTVQREGLKDTTELEGRFMDRMADFVKAQGRIAAAWDEIVTGAPTPGTLIFWWRHDKTQILEQALAAGYPVVLSPRTPCYFDYPQDRAFPKTGWKLYNTSRLVYAGPVIPDEIPASQRSQIIGVEGCLWTEHIDTVPYLEFSTFPRLPAFAEMAWTPDAQRNYAGFEERLKPFLAEYRRDGIYFYDKNNPLGSLRAADPLLRTMRSTNQNLN